MTSTSFNLSGKIDPEILTVIQHIKSITEKINIPFFIVGAIARDFIFKYWQIESPRMTMDIDIAIRIPNWDRFHELEKAFLESDVFVKDRESQRFLYNNFIVDIIPFGDIAKDQVINWPPDFNIAMSVVGFDQAWDYSSIVRLNNEPELDVRIPTLPGMALMKLLSWHTAYPERNKDAKDFWFIMNHYEFAGIADRLYKTEFSLFEKEDYNLQHAGYVLLGKDIAAICNKETKALVKQILADETDQNSSNKLILQMLTPQDQFEKILKGLEKLETGFNSQIN